MPIEIEVDARARAKANHVAKNQNQNHARDPDQEVTLLPNFAPGDAHHCENVNHAVLHQ